MTAPWPLRGVTDKMIVVHGRCILPLFKSRSKALTFAPRRFFQTARQSLPFVITLQNVPIPRSRHDAVARAKARFCPAFMTLLTRFAPTSKRSISKPSVNCRSYSAPTTGPCASGPPKDRTDGVGRRIQSSLQRPKAHHNSFLVCPRTASCAIPTHAIRSMSLFTLDRQIV